MSTTLEAGVGSRTWRALGVPVQVLVTDARCARDAQRLLAQDLAALDLACSRFRDDSEIVALAAAQGEPFPASPLLREAVRVALAAAEQTDGDVDPTLGATLVRLGYDRDFASLAAGLAPPVTLARQADWREVRVDDRCVQLPAGVLLDLGATAKALAADRAAARLHAELGVGVLVNLGGDLSIAGPAPEHGWAVRVQDVTGDVGRVPGGSTQTVSVSAGGLATSSTTARRWRRGGQVLHHILDPRTGVPARSPWRTVSVAAASCVRANTLSTAAIVRGEGALSWFASLGVPARLVGHRGTVTTTGGWPVEQTRSA